MTNRPCVNKQCVFYPKEGLLECLLFYGVGANESEYCKKYIPEPEPSIAGKIIDIDWCHWCTPTDWQYEAEIPTNYRFKCFEFTLPNNTKRWATVPVMFVSYNNNKGVCEFTAQTRDKLKYKTIRASKVIFERVEEGK